MCFLEMSHLITSAYNMVCIDLTRYGFSKTFFPLQSVSPQNPTNYIMCIGCISKSLYCVQVYLKLGCHIPQTSLEWTTHSTKKVETWLDHFLDKMKELTKLNEI